MKVHEALEILKSFDFIANTHTAHEMIKLGAATACIINLLDEMEKNNYLMTPNVFEVFIAGHRKNWDWAAYDMQGVKWLFKGSKPKPVYGGWQINKGDKKRKITFSAEIPVMNYKDTLIKL